MIIFIDMLLHKPQVYRHLLFNRRVAKVGRPSRSLFLAIDTFNQGDVYRFGFLLLLFDVCGLRVPECGLALQNNTAIRYQMVPA